MACPDSDARAEIRALSQRVAAEKQRAARAASLVDKYEAQGALPPQSLWPLWARLRGLHQRIEDRHLAAARIMELHITRMESWLEFTGGAAPRPAFIAAVASALGTPSATATLRGLRHTTVAAASSDATARAAHELETIMAEGPATDAATTGACIAIAGPALLDRWPRYGCAVAGVGVRAVTAAPLGPPGTRLGALCAYGAEPVIRDGAATATNRMAAGLTQMILGAARVPGFGRGGTFPLVFGEDGYQAVVHQAAGMVSVQCDCGVDAAHDLLLARAFADGVPVEQVATRVVRGEITLR